MPKYNVLKYIILSTNSNIECLLLFIWFSMDKCESDCALVYTYMRVYVIMCVYFVLNA